MTLFALSGALEAGLIFGLVAMGVYISFRLLHLPDLTVDGSFPLGGAATAVAIVSGMNPFLATALGTVAGAAAGLLTAVLSVRLKIMSLLAGILTMVALYSINLRVMGRPNISLFGYETVFSPVQALFGGSIWSNAVMLAAIAIVAKLLLDWFLATEIGLALRASGENPTMSTAHAIDNDRMVIVGMVLSNGLVGLAGSVFAQSQGVADVSLGIGTVVVGLAAVIIGEASLGTSRIWLATLGCLVGALLYRLLVAVALGPGALGLQAHALNLVTAVVVAFAVCASRARQVARGRIKCWVVARFRPRQVPPGR